MEALDYSVATWGYGLTALGFLAFTVHLATAWRRNLRGILLFATIALSACWAASATAFTLYDSRAWWIATVVFGALRTSSWLVFLLSLLYFSAKDAPTGGRRWLAWPPWISGLIVANAAANILFQGFPDLTRSWFGASSQIPYLPNLIFSIGGLMLVEQVARNMPVTSRWAIKPLCLALAGTFGFDLYFFTNTFLFRQVDVDVWAVRGVVNLLVLPLIAVSSVRSTEWTFKISVSRQLVFHTAALLASGLYLLGVAGAGFYLRIFGGSWGAALETVLFFSGLLSLCLLILSGTLRSKLRVFLNKHFFSYRYDYRQEWLRFTQSLTSHDPAAQGLPERVIKALADLVESTGGCLWLAEADGTMRLTARLNFPNTKGEEPSGSSMREFLERTRWVLDLEEFKSKPQHYEGLSFSPWLEELEDAWLIIPLFSGDELFGFVVLSASRAHVEVNWEVLDLLKTGASQAASYLSNMRATEALLEAKKFDSFNRMSAFVVHDVKNLVAQLSLLLKNAEKHKDNPEFQQDMFMTIDHVVERMKQLLLQLRAGTTPVDQPRPISLAAVIDRVYRSKAGQEPLVEMLIEDEVEALGHKDRLERVIGHLVQNALEATPADGRVWMRLYGEGSKAIIEVGDTGHGMSADFVRDHLFKPFDSTKSAGMGIGAYESSQYITELGGQMQVESKEKQGTVFKVQLPRHITKVQSPAADMEKA